MLHVGIGAGLPLRPHRVSGTARCCARAAHRARDITIATSPRAHQIAPSRPRSGKTSRHQAGTGGRVGAPGGLTRSDELGIGPTPRARVTRQDGVTPQAVPPTTTDADPMTSTRSPISTWLRCWFAARCARVLEWVTKRAVFSPEPARYVRQRLRSWRSGSPSFLDAGPAQPMKAFAFEPTAGMPQSCRLPADAW